MNKLPWSPPKKCRWYPAPECSRTPLGAFSAGGGTVVPVDISYTATAVDTTDTDEYTFPSLSIGAEASNRKILVGVAARSTAAAGARTILSVNVQGNGCRQVVVRDALVASDSNIGAIFVIDNPLPGTTATIVVRFSGTMGRCGVHIWRMTGSAVLASDSDSSIADPGAATLDVAAGGAAVGLCLAVGTSTPPTFSWTGLTEDNEATIEANTTHSAAHANFSSSSALAISCDPTGTLDLSATVFAAWAPAIAPTYIGPADINTFYFFVGLRAANAANLGQDIVRLRRGSDNAEQNFAAQTTGTYKGTIDAVAAIAWRDAVGASTAYVVTLFDQIGSIDLTQATASLQPICSFSVFADSLPTMIFDGVDDYLINSAHGFSTGPRIHYAYRNKTTAGGAAAHQGLMGVRNATANPERMTQSGGASGTYDGQFGASAALATPWDYWVTQHFRIIAGTSGYMNRTSVYDTGSSLGIDQFGLATHGSVPPALDPGLAMYLGATAPAFEHFGGNIQEYGFGEPYSWNFSTNDENAHNFWAQKLTDIVASYGVMATLQMYVDPDQLTYTDAALTTPANADGDKVGGWDDVKTPGGTRKWSQATAGNRPTLKTNIVNGHRAIRFSNAGPEWLDGVDITSFFGASGAGEIIALVKSNAVGDQALFSFGNTSSDEYYPLASDGFIRDGSFIPTTKTVTQTAALTVMHCVDITSVNSDYSLWINGVSQMATGSNFVFSVNTAPKLGKSKSGATHFDGDLALLVVFSSKVVAVQHRIIRSHIKKRYGAAFNTRTGA